MNDQTIMVNSEIGDLKKVLLRRPGKELDRLTVLNKDELLFDDLLWLEGAQKEHDLFAATLKEYGVEVLYLRDLLVDILDNIGIRASLIEDILLNAPLDDFLKSILKQDMLEMDSGYVADIILAGLTKGEFLDLQFRKPDWSFVLEVLKKEDFLINPLPNLYFQRDPYFCIGNNVVISSMSFPARKRESNIGKYIFSNHPDFRNLSNVITELNRSSQSLLTIEGGDVLILSEKVLAIGISQRTNPAAIYELGKTLSRLGDPRKIMAINIPKTRSAMHLDTVFTMVRQDTFAIFKDICDHVRIWEIDFKTNGEIESIMEHNDLRHALEKALSIDYISFVEAGAGDPIMAMRDQWNDGSNLFAISPGLVISYERNKITNAALSDKGIRVLEIKGSELGRGRGGPRCMTMPLLRSELK